MRRFLEFPPRLRPGGPDFVIKTEPHPFLLNLQRAIGVGRSWRVQPLPGFFLGMFRRVSSQ